MRNFIQGLSKPALSCRRKMYYKTLTGREKYMKKWKYGLLLFFTCGILAGCGNGENKNSSVREDFMSEDDYVYVAETEAFDDTGLVMGVCSTGEKVYITTYKEENSDNRVVSIDLSTRERTFLSLPLEQEGASRVNGIAVDPSGNLVFFERSRREESTFYYIKTCSINQGELISRLDVTSFFEGMEPVFVSEMAVDEENRFYLTVRGSILAFSEQGQELFRINPGVAWISITIDADGDFIFLGHTSGIEGELSLGSIDTENKGAVHYFDKFKGDVAQGGLARGEAGEFYLSYDGSVYVYDKEQGKITEEVFSWQKNYINGRNLLYFSPVGEERFFAVQTEQMGSDEYSTQLVWLNKTLQSEVQPRKILTLGTFESNVGIKAYVDYFNRMNTEYWMEIKTYCWDFNDQEQAWQARVQMMLDLVSGNGPDLIETTFLDFNMLASKGIVEDLYPYLNADPDLRDVEFFTSVLDVCSVDGKLCCIPDSFGFDILIGREEDCGGLSNLMLEELFAFGEQYAGGRRLVEYDKDNLLAVLFGSMFSRYVDWDVGECRLNSEEFIRLLEFVDRFGMSGEEAEAVWSLPEDMDQEYVLERMDIFNALDYKAMELRVGDPVVLVGYPVNEDKGGNGALLSFHPRFQICSYSENKEGAWEFIRCFLLPEYYERTLDTSPEYMAFPSRRDMYDRVFERWMETETGSNEGGEERIQGIYAYTDCDGRWGSEVVTQEDKDAVTRIIDNIAVSRGTWNEDILVIITEEAAPFFAGQKSAGEVADIIQSRVQMYVNENR